MAPESSALLDLSMQQVSTHAYLKPSPAARAANLLDFLISSLLLGLVSFGLCVFVDEKHLLE
jgi:hypothetical protein